MVRLFCWKCFDTYLGRIRDVVLYGIDNGKLRRGEFVGECQQCKAPPTVMMVQ